MARKATAKNNKMTKAEEQELLKSGFKRCIVTAIQAEDRKQGTFHFNGTENPLETPIWLDESAINGIEAQKFFTKDNTPITPYSLAQERNITMDEAEAILEANRMNGDAMISAEQGRWVNKYVVKPL